MGVVRVWGYDRPRPTGILHFAQYYYSIRSIIAPRAPRRQRTYTHIVVNGVFPIYNTIYGVFWYTHKNNRSKAISYYCNTTPTKIIT